MAELGWWEQNENGQTMSKPSLIICEKTETKMLLVQDREQMMLLERRTKTLKDSSYQSTSITIQSFYRHNAHSLSVQILSKKQKFQKVQDKNDF